MPSPFSHAGFRQFFEGLAAKGAAGGAVSRLGGLASSGIAKGGRLGLAGGLLGALPIVGDVGMGMGDALFSKIMGRGPGETPFGQQVEEDKKGRMMELATQMKRERLMQANRENVALLARYMPHEFQSIMAGRDLPEGAVMVGGQPRTDLLAEMATRMSTGQYSQPGSASSQFLGQQKGMP